ncbi:MAG: tRNA/rRNA methyltransferase [Myxococcota bacterium]
MTARPGRKAGVSRAREQASVREQVSVREQASGGDVPASSELEERRIYGLAACKQRVQHHPEEVRRIWLLEEVAQKHFGPFLRRLAEQRLSYHLVTAAELERLTESQHHEGVCLQVLERVVQPVEAYLRQVSRRGRRVVLALEGVGNPHNLGAILRIAAHFGVEAVVMPGARALLSGAALRTAEGGGEHVLALEAGDFIQTLTLFKQAGYRVVTTSSHKGSELFQTPLPERLLLVLGEEQSGLSRAAFEVGELCVRIPGTGQVESLNVSVATGILLAEHWRQHPVRKSASPKGITTGERL